MNRPYLWLLAFLASIMTIASSTLLDSSAIARDIKSPIQIISSVDESTKLSSNNDFLRLPLIGQYTKTSDFGWRFLGREKQFHKGIDLATAEGTSVVAARTGKVSWASPWRGYGNLVTLEHTNPPEVTLYAHLSRINVEIGQLVSGGDVIGEVGSTGNSTSPHLHFELGRPDENGEWFAIDPLKFLTQSPIELKIPPEYKEQFIEFGLPNCSDVTWGHCQEDSITIPVPPPLAP